MKVRAVIRIKNELLVSVRERMGISQQELGIRVGVNTGTINALENLRLRNIRPDSLSILKVSQYTGLLPDEVAPPSLCGKNLQTKFEQTGEIAPQVLLENAQMNSGRFLLPSPVEQVELEDMVEFVKNLMSVNLGENTLSEKERKTILLRYGIGGTKTATLKEVGRSMGVSREIVRQREAKAIRKLKSHLKKHSFEGKRLNYE